MSFNKKNINAIKAGFEYKCLFILIEGYYLMKVAQEYSLSWEEEQLTAKLIDHIEKGASRNKWKIHIKSEIRNYTKEIITGKKLPKSASRIDMKFFSWLNEKEEIYSIEAKNLCEKNWIKENGVEVKATNLQKRYIVTGIEHFFSGYYPLNGCVCGYILEGDCKKIVSKLNLILKKRNSLHELKKTEAINNYQIIYQISNPGETIKLKNVFLEF